MSKINKGDYEWGGREREEERERERERDCREDATMNNFIV